MSDNLLYSEVPAADLLYPGAFAKTRRVPSYDVGPDHRLTIPGLLRHLHDLSQRHANDHGFGYRGLLEEGRAWALASLQLGFAGPMPLGESNLSIATSVSRAAGPVVFRDYAAATEQGVLLYGQSMWALIDLQTRLTATPSAELRACLREIAQRTSAIQPVKRLPAGEPLPKVDQRRVRIHDCDFNGHLNNTVGVQWMLDALAPALIKNSGGDDSKILNTSLAAKQLRVTYHHEAVLGDTLFIGFRQNLSQGNFILELRKADDVLIANCSIVLEDQS